MRPLIICSMLAILLVISGITYAATGAISGRVTDNSGNPIAGLTILMCEFPPEDDDEELTSTVTGSDGNYTITGLPSGAYMVGACPGDTGLPYINKIYENTTHYPQATSVTVTAPGATINIDFQLAPSGAITGRVTDMAGNPIADMWVDAENYDDETGMCQDARTNTNGDYVITGLPPGDYRVHTEAGESGLSYADCFYNNVTSWCLANRVTLTGTETKSGIDFYLNQGGAISGMVTDSGGQPIEGLWVEACDYTSGSYIRGAETEANGVYNLAGVPTGSYRVYACAACREMSYVNKYYDNATDWGKASMVTVVAPNTMSGINFVLSIGTSISGHVYGLDSSTGNYVPLQGAHLNAENYTSGFWCGWAQSGDDGSYTLSGLEPGSYRVRAEKEPYIQQYYPNAMDWSQSQAVEVTVDTPPTEIDFHLNLGGSISGIIVDQDTGQPIINNVWINANPTTGEPWGRGTNQIGEDGSYTLSGLPPGSYKLCINATGYDQEFYEDETDWMLAEPVTVAEGQSIGSINFALRREAGGAIIGQVILSDGSPVAYAHVNADSMENMKWKGGDTEPNGYFVITGITPGQWRMRAQPPFGPDYINVSESDEMIITMPVDTSLYSVGQIILPTVNLIGQVLMPDGTPATWAPVNIETLDWSYFAHVQTDQGGYFRKGGLDAGTYRIKVEIQWGMSGIIPPDPMIVEIVNPNVVLDIGAITYATAAKHIAGWVQREDSSGVANVQVNACRQGGEGWANTQTDANGQFNLDVASGTWEVMICPGPMQSSDSGGVDWVYTGFPEVVTFADNMAEETKTVTFTVKSASSHVIGRVIGPNDETLRQGASWIDIRDDSGRGNGVPVNVGGLFDVAVSAGTYNIWVGIDQQTYPYWSSPRLAPFTVEENQTIDLGDIRLVAKTSGVQGQVTRSSDGQPISGVSVHAWQRDGGWADARTDDQGNYRLSLIAGTWDICAEPPFSSSSTAAAASYVSGQPPQTVVVGDNEVVTGVNFQLQEADGSIALSLYDSDGALLTDIDGGWAYASEGEFSMKPTAGGPINNGQCTIKLPSGTYRVGVCLPPNTGYTMSGEQEVTVADVEVPVNITLLTNDAVISGTFYTDASKTTPATGIEGEVFAMQKMGGVWQSTQINSADASYQLHVAAGEWNLGYWIRSAGYINNPPPDSKVTVASEATQDYDFVLVSADATIQGVVLDPDGNPMVHVWVWAHSEGDGSPGSRIDNGCDAREPDGRFTINVPSGREYEVGSGAPSEWGYIQPDFQRVTPEAGQTVDVTLQYKESDATITGSVYYKDGDTNVPCEWAWVNAWSDNGQHTGTNTYDDGNFLLNVSVGTTWHLEAMYHPEEELTFYRSLTPVDVIVNASEKTANLEVMQSDRTLPPAVSATFDPNVGWNSTLEDGSRIEIPGGAIPADGNVCISFTPMIDDLQTTATDKPIGWGYTISISEQSTGNPITDNFNTNVLITFAYSDEDLTEEGLTEDDISPAYFSTTTNSWTKVESFTIDKDANTVTVQINHFSVWALTGGPSEEGEEEVQTVDMTITKCAVKAGKTQGQDSFNASGTFAESPPDLNDITQIDVNIVSLDDDYLVYEESIDFDASGVVNGKFKYKGQLGAITSLTIDFTNKTFKMKAKNIDLTGLGCPLQLNVTLGSYMLSGEADEDIVNVAKKIPIRLMRTYKDEMRIKSAKAKNSTKALADMFTVKGEIAVEDVSVNLSSEDVVITWGDQTFTIPAGSFTAQSGNSYRCSKIAATGDSGLVTAKIDLDKCTFNISVKNADLDVTSGAVGFGISFGDFDETAEINLP